MTDRRTPTSGHPLGFLGSPCQDPPKAKGKALSLSTRTLRCRTEATGRFSQNHHIRDLMPFGGGGDVEALSLLNDDMMPSPSEALLAALGSCLSVSIQANAVARAIPIRRLVIELEGDIDFAALWGTGDLGLQGPRFRDDQHQRADRGRRTPRRSQGAPRSCGAMVTPRQHPVQPDQPRYRADVPRDRASCANRLTIPRGRHRPRPFRFGFAIICCIAASACALASASWLRLRTSEGSPRS